MGAAIIAILGVTAALIGAFGTLLGFMYSRNQNRRESLEARTKAEITARAQEEATRALAQGAADTARSARTDATRLGAEVTLIDRRVSVLESKMDVFWRNVAFDVSKILHSPHEGWEAFDLLLEKFGDSIKGIGPDLTDDEMRLLETQLNDMVEGRWTPVGMTRADQVAASLMLRAIEQTKV